MFLSVFHPEVIYIADGTRYKRHGFVLTFYLYIFIYKYILFFFEVGVVFRSRLTCSFICADGHDHIEFFSFFFFTYYVYIGTWLNHLGEAKVTASTLPPPLTRYVCAH